MQKREQIIAEARKWVETPYLHQHAILGFGADCLAVVREPGIACDVLTWDEDLFEPFRAYGEQPNPRNVIGMLESFFVPVEGEPLLADIVCLQWRPNMPMHLALLSQFKSRRTLIHAWRQHGKVVEHGFAAEWPGMAHSWWRYPGLAD